MPKHIFRVVSSNFKLQLIKWDKILFKNSGAVESPIIKILVLPFSARSEGNIGDETLSTDRTEEITQCPIVN